MLYLNEPPKKLTSDIVTTEVPIIHVAVQNSSEYHVYDQAAGAGELPLQASTFRNELIQVRVAGASVAGSQ